MRFSHNDAYTKNLLQPIQLSQSDHTPPHPNYTAKSICVVSSLKYIVGLETRKMAIYGKGRDIDRND